MKKTECQIINRSKNPLPDYQTKGAAAGDLMANVLVPKIIKPMERLLVPTGIYIALPQGYEAQVRPRSGLAMKFGITVLNSPGTIDSDYRGEIGVVLINLSNKDFKISNGDRIAQLVVSSYCQLNWVESKTLDETDRGARGFGSTGTNS